MVNPQTILRSFIPQGSQETQDQQQDDNNKDMVSNNIIENHDFLLTTLEPYWILTSDHGFVASSELGNYLHGVLPATNGGNYAVVTNRTETSHGLEQYITERILAGITYTFNACVRVYANGRVLQAPAKVEATLRLEYNTLQDNSQPPDKYEEIASTLVSTDYWVNLKGSFKLETKPDHVVFYLEGPEPGIDLLVDSVVVLSIGN